MANLTQTRQATLSSSSDKRRTRFIAHAKSEIPLEYRNDYIVPTLFVSNKVLVQKLLWVQLIN